MPKFVNWYYIIKEIFNEYESSGLKPKLSQDQDPFWDPPEYKRIGEGHMKLLNLAYLLDNKADLVFVDELANKGSLKVALIPLDTNFEPLQDDDPIFDTFVDDPNYFINK